MSWTLIQALLSGFELGLAGLFGALAATRFHKDELHTFGDWGTFLLTGLASGQFLTGFVVAYFSIDRASGSGVAFLLGLFGGSLIASLMKAIKSADLLALFKSRIGGG